MANPFDSTVGLKGVTTSDVPIWINDISGMSTELVGAVADREDFATDDTAGITTTWQRIRRLAMSKLLNLIEGELSKSADFQYVGARTGSLTGVASDLVILPSPVWSGYSITAPVAATDELYLKSLSLDSATVGPVTTSIHVYDPKGAILLTKAVTIQPGYNELPVDFAIRSRFGRLAFAFIGINVSALSLRALGVGQQWECVDNGFGLDAVTSAVADTNNVGSLVLQGFTGIMLEASVRRSLSDVVTRYVDRLGWCYAHLLGSLLMTEKLASTNVNLFTNTNRLFTEQLEARLMDEAKSLLRPVTRSMVKDLRPTKAIQSDSEYQQGYFPESFV